MRTLLKRLVYTVPNSAATPLMHLDLSSPIQSSDSAALWRYLAVKVNLGTDAQREDIIRRVCTKLQTQNVILILRGVDYISEEHLHKIIHEFWEPLAIVAYQTQCPPNRYLLLMFLVDYRGGVKEWKISCAERPDESWKPHIPISLPAVTKFSDRDLSKWIDHWSETLYDILPDNLRQGPLEVRVQSILEKSDDGIPDLVMSHICSQCGFYLEGAEECLRL